MLRLILETLTTFWPFTAGAIAYALCMAYEVLTRRRKAVSVTVNS